MPWSQIAPCARIRTAPGWRRASSTSPSASGGRPRPAWIRIGTPRAFGEREHVVHLAAVEDEVLRARMQLDAARAGRQAAFALGERIFGGVEAAERDQPAVAFSGPREHAVVGHAVGGPALGVVQREYARAAGVGGVELCQQLLERQRASVLVEAEVRVRVDHFGVGGAQPLAPRRGRERGRRRRARRS